MSEGLLSPLVLWLNRIAATIGLLLAIAWSLGGLVVGAGMAFGGRSPDKVLLVILFELALPIIIAVLATKRSYFYAGRRRIVAATAYSALALSCGPFGWMLSRTGLFW